MSPVLIFVLREVKAELTNFLDWKRICISFKTVKIPTKGSINAVKNPYIKVPKHISKNPIYFNVLSAIFAQSMKLQPDPLFSTNRKKLELPNKNATPPKLIIHIVNFSTFSWNASEKEIIKSLERLKLTSDHILNPEDNAEKYLFINEYLVYIYSLEDLALYI